ncbi:M48 family metallopeptidase [Haloarchaeobius sp. HME9146]|uniref:M48 family metallopeptidase n=1 Tax=Haloarchaeobius sp. HME9146 TaxID=2978732 RepID=UPI0021C1E86B|nr:M48 family metalloprotease [Haloarchaeobius sp. HME9146]MCT9097654.1 M48 family metalloprotease [Haloarchaeobius sp. HME9146]
MSRSVALSLRMVVALFGLLVVTLTLGGVLFVVFTGASLFVVGLGGGGEGGVVLSLAAGALGTLVVMGWSVRRELGDSPLQGLGRGRRDAPAELTRLVTTTSQQLDIPAPTIRLVESETPLAMVTGLRRRDATLVLSTGVTETLDPDELAAVVAHELAHVANRDVTLTSLCAIPVFVADDLFQWGLGTLGSDDIARKDGNLVGLLAAGASVAVGGCFLVVGRGLLLLFSRQRELAADRTAVEVTGQPGALASALASLDERFDAAPTLDPRATDRVEAFSIVPPPPEDPTPDVLLGPEGTRLPYGWTFERLRIQFTNRLPGTHPRTESRIERLRQRA